MFRLVLKRTMTSVNKKPNRLINEKSPYLLQHAYNPVDWYPWSKEAFEKAAHDGKMIFLSVGYSTCHWCHVMEYESFEDEQVGKLMNELFVNIKVDREERPDVDRMYMEFVQATTGGGGWPMSVWLTPELKPVVGGTYFPPNGRFGRPGFSDILQHIADKWKNNRSSVEHQGDKILEAMSDIRSHKTRDSQAEDYSTISPHISRCAKLCQEYFVKSYDSEWGGFGDAPKFPQASIFEFLILYDLYVQRSKGQDKSSNLDMVDHTLKRMASGGIHDHVAQGFHRYSTDDKWHVPHFEKMLYDQAQLASVFAKMYQVTKDDLFSEITQDILTYVDRDLGHKDGGFHSAEDADSLSTFDSTKKKEGAFCVWTKQEIYDALNDVTIGNNVKAADIFCEYFSVKEKGNVDPMQDPHHELTGKNVLISFKPITEIASKFSINESEVRQALDCAKKILFEIRTKRPKPHLDSKILTSWNGLMISGFFRAAIVLKNQTFGNRAEKALSFIKNHLYEESTKRLLRSAYVDNDERTIVKQTTKCVYGFADDYANLICALLDAYEFSFDSHYVQWAIDLQTTMDEIFYFEPTKGTSDDAVSLTGFYYSNSAEDSSILMRLIEDHDGAEPSANSVALWNNIRLFGLTSDEKYERKAKKIASHFFKKIQSYPFTMPKMMCSMMALESPPTQIVVVCRKAEIESLKMIDLLRTKYRPFSTIVVISSQDDPLLSINRHLNSMASNFFKQTDEKPWVFVCSNFVCQSPVKTTEELSNLLA